MSKTVTPVVMSDDGNRHESMQDGEVLPVSSVPISTNRQNLLETDATGLLLTGEGIVSQLDHNAIVTAVDGKLYLKLKNMVSPEDQVLKVVENLVRADISLEFNQADSKLTLRGKDRAVISEMVLPIIPGIPVEMEVLENYVPPKPEGFVENPYKRGTYLHIRYRQGDGKEIDTYVDFSKLKYDPGKGIDIDGKTINVDIKPGGGLKFDECCAAAGCVCPSPLVVDKEAVAELLVSDKDNVLTVTKDGEVTAEIRLIYDATTRTVSLVGKNDAPLGQATITLPEIPGIPTAADFVDDPIGYPSGRYLFLQFRLTDGTTKDLYLNVSPLVDVFTGGDGIIVNGNVINVDYNETLRIIEGQLAVYVSKLIALDDEFMYVSKNRINTQIGLALNNRTLTLTGVNAAPVATVELPKDDAAQPIGADWLKEFTPADGGETGTYLRLHYAESSGLGDFLINFNPVVFLPGDGLIEKDDKAIINLPENGPFKFTAKGELDLAMPNLVNKSEDNALQVSPVDGKLYVKDTGLSAEKLGSGLTVDKTSGELQLKLADVIQDNVGLTVKDGKIGIDMDALAKLISDKIVAPVSADTGNALQAGTDGKPYFPSDWGNLQG